jgi:predicted RNase H-like HicB family nuclease
MINYTAKYTKIESGYMGQLVEWPEVVTEGRDLEECRAMLRDALQEMVLAYQQLGKEIPPGNALIEQLPIPDPPPVSAPNARGERPPPTETVERTRHSRIAARR